MSRGWFPAFVIWLASALLACAGLPTLYIVGDSTVRNSTAGQMGWGDPLIAHFDPAKIQVVNRAIGGRSSRTFLTEGRWDAVMTHLKAGDFVLIQFGHNDGGKLNDDRCRASIRGVGMESEDIIRQTDGKAETVRSYGWYLRSYVEDAKRVGATPILVSPIPRNIWTDGKIARDTKAHALWAKQAAEALGAPFIDFNRLLADRYEALGPEQTAAWFAGSDHTHTSPAGAECNAAVMAEALRSLADCQIGKCLLPADLWLPRIFGNHMVLQRDMPVPVWGTASPGAEVSVRIAGKHVTAKAGDDGKWRAEIQALTAGGPHVMEVSCFGARRSFQDVMVGEVWLCSGQSNMDFTLAKTEKRSFSGVTDWPEVIAEAYHPRLRMFTAEWTTREFPQRDVAGAWAVCTPQSAGDFSAVAYHFGLAIQRKLDVPVGLVTCAFGASTIEAWISDNTLTAHPQFAGLLKDFGRKKIAFRDDPKLFADYGKALASWNGKGRRPSNPDPVHDQHHPSVLHNGMIAPIIPFPIRGVLWYQGESNLNTRGLYADLQQALIGEWRSLWNQPELPFYFVQLAAYRSPSADPSAGGQIAGLREAQAKSLTIPHTGMAVTIDIGDEKDVHPRNKLDVGERLARLALCRTYGKSGVDSGPLFREAMIEGKTIRVRFDHSGGGLVAVGGPLRRFAIAGNDGKFVHAVAVIDGDSVIVSSSAVSTPAYVRYAWADNPAGANLFNAEGLPAAPFRTDP